MAGGEDKKILVVPSEICWELDSKNSQPVEFCVPESTECERRHRAHKWISTRSRIELTTRSAHNFKFP